MRNSFTLVRSSKSGQGWECYLSFFRSSIFRSSIFRSSIFRSLKKIDCDRIALLEISIRRPWSNRSRRSFKKIDRDRIPLVNLLKKLDRERIAVVDLWNSLSDRRWGIDPIDLSITKNERFDRKTDDRIPNPAFWRSAVFKQITKTFPCAYQKTLS